MRLYRLSPIVYNLSLIFFLFITLLPAAVFADQHSVESGDPFGQQIQFRKPQPRVILPGLGFGEITRDGDYIYVPFLGKYIAAVYRFAVAAASIIAVIVIIFSGFQWTASGGSQDAIGSAKKHIVGAVTGLILAVGSYTILYAVNPELVQFRSLRVKFVETKSYEEFLAEAEGFESESDATVSSVYSVTKPTWTHETFDCAKRGTYTPTGVADPNSLEKYTCPVGVFGDITTIREMRQPLCEVGEILNKLGFGIKVTGSYRSFSSQVNLWCGSGATQYPNTEQRKKAFAVPGFSPHGSGVAVDVHLTDKSGNRCYTDVTARNQCTISGVKLCGGQQVDMIKTLAEAFYEADPKFYRYKREMWHFEFIKGNPVSRHQRTPSDPTAIQCPGPI